MAELADARDLKSRGRNPVPVRPRSPAPYRGVEQLVARRAHNPEVEGSNPSPATINPSESVDSDGFSLVFITFLGSLFLLFLFDPNRDPYGILSCSLETGHDSLAQSSLEAAGEQVSHGFCRLPLGCRGHVGVSVQGEPGAEVPQHPRHRFHIHPVLQGQGGKCVP